VLNSGALFKIICLPQLTYIRMNLTIVHNYEWHNNPTLQTFRRKWHIYIYIYIFTTIICYHRIIRSNTSLQKEEIWEGLKCSVSVVAFRWISVNRNGTLNPSCVDQLEVLSPKIFAKSFNLRQISKYTLRSLFKMLP